MTGKPPRVVRMIPVDRIDVLNPRERNGKVFETIVENIRAVGLKKPIAVTPRPAADGAERYLLICGEGRLKAFKSLQEPAIPALVVDCSDEDALIMSLAENVARRSQSALELLHGIQALDQKGYSPRDIAAKTGLSVDYTQGIVFLLKHGEERLLVAVQAGRIPLSAALAIVDAGEDGEAVQAALHAAYESGALRGRKLMAVRRLIDRRRALGRSTVKRPAPAKKPITAASLIQAYQREVEGQKALVKKAEAAQERLMFVTSALRQLLSEDRFMAILREQALDTVPKYLAERVAAMGAAA